MRAFFYTHQQLQRVVVPAQYRLIATPVGCEPTDVTPPGPVLSPEGQRLRQFDCFGLSDSCKGVCQCEESFEVRDRAGDAIDHRVWKSGGTQDMNGRFELPGRVVGEGQQVAHLHVPRFLDHQEFSDVDQILVAAHVKQKAKAGFGRSNQQLWYVQYFILSNHEPCHRHGFGGSEQFRCA